MDHTQGGTGHEMDALALAGTNDREELQKPLAHPADKTAESSLNGLFLQLSGLCSMAAKPIALMIDERDSASSHQVFFNFSQTIFPSQVAAAI